MSGDSVLHGIVPAAGLRVVWVHATQVVRDAARIHATLPTATSALARLSVGALLVAKLGKGDQRVTLQLTGPGPLRSQFVDCTAGGQLRAYVGTPGVRPAPGRDRDDLIQSFGAGAQFVVLREMKGGELYRGNIVVEHGRLERVLGAYFERSEQIETALSLDVRLSDDGAVESARGLLIQKLPGGDSAALELLRAALEAGALRATDPGTGALPPLPGLEGLEVLERSPAVYRCGCTKERAERGVLAAGKDEILDMIATEHGTSLTCEFCRTEYKFSAAELCALVDRAEGRDGGSSP